MPNAPWEKVVWDGDAVDVATWVKQVQLLGMETSWFVTDMRVALTTEQVCGNLWLHAHTHTHTRTHLLSHNPNRPYHCPHKQQYAIILAVQ